MMLTKTVAIICAEQKKSNGVVYNKGVVWICCSINVSLFVCIIWIKLRIVENF